MSSTVLILGASGRFGRHAEAAFAAAGWSVRTFKRGTDKLPAAAQGVDVIVNAWNPEYPDWQKLLPRLHKEVADAAAKSGATVLLPGNVYVFGPETATPWSEVSAHAAQNPLGAIRRQIEDGYRQAGARTVILRAGDFLDDRASGNWFDRVMTAKLGNGVFTYPGNPDIAHAWAYLPDLARAAVALSTIRDRLPACFDVPFPGYTLSGEDIKRQLQDLIGQSISLKQMSWLPIQLIAPVWRMGACLLEMRYLWDTPHSLDGGLFSKTLPAFEHTPAPVAFAQTLQGLGFKARSTQTSL